MLILLLLLLLLLLSLSLSLSFPSAYQSESGDPVLQLLALRAVISHSAGGLERASARLTGS